MFGFEVIQYLKPNDEILEIIKNYENTGKNRKIKHLKATYIFTEEFQCYLEY